MALTYSRLTRRQKASSGVRTFSLATARSACARSATEFVLHLSLNWEYRIFIGVPRRRPPLLICRALSQSNAGFNVYSVLERASAVAGKAGRRLVYVVMAMVSNSTLALS
jgi:hypothetical protein